MRAGRLFTLVLTPFLLSGSAYADKAGDKGSVQHYSKSQGKNGTVAVQIPSPTMKCPACEVYVNGKWKCKTQADAAKISGAPTMCKSK